MDDTDTAAVGGLVRSLFLFSAPGTQWPVASDSTRAENRVAHDRTTQGVTLDRRRQLADRDTSTKLARKERRAAEQPSRGRSTARTVTAHTPKRRAGAGRKRRCDCSDCGTVTSSAAHIACSGCPVAARQAGRVGSQLGSSSPNRNRTDRTQTVSRCTGRPRAFRPPPEGPSSTSRARGLR